MLNGIINSVDTSLSKFWETVKDREAWHAIVYGKVEGSIETYVLPYVKLDSGNVLYDTGSSNHALITRVLLLIYVFKEEG